MKSEKTLMINTLLLGAASVISKAVVFFLMPLYTACLSPADFGEADIFISTAALLIPFVSLNAPEALFRFFAGEEGDKRTLLSSGIALLLPGFLLFAVVFPITSYIPALAPYRYDLIAYVAASVARSFAAHYVRAEGYYLLYAVQQVFCSLVTVTLEILLLPVLRLGVSGYLLAIILADGITALILLLGLGVPREFSLTAVQGSVMRRMLRYALPLIPASVLWWITSVSDRYILLTYRGREATGMYAAAGRLPAVLTLGLTVFLEAWHYAALRCEEKERKKLFDRVYGLLLPALILLASVIMLAARSVVAYLYAEEYEAAARYIPLLTIAALYAGLSSFLGSVYAVRLQSVFSLLTALGGAAVNLALNFWWIPRGGAIAAAAATLAAYAVVFALRMMHGKNMMDLHPRFLKLGASTAFLLGMAVLSMRRLEGVAALLVIPALLPFYAELREGMTLLQDFSSFLAKKRRKKRERY